MTSHRWSFAGRSFVVASLVVLAGYAAAGASAAGASATGASAAGPPPGSIHSGTSLSDSRIAHDAQLRASDFPRDWLSIPGPTSLGHSPCPGVNAAQAAVSGHAISPQFTGKDANTAGSTTYIYTDSREATHAFGQLTNRHTRDCVVRTITQNTMASAGQNTTIGPFRVHRLAVPPIGDQTSGYRLSVRVSSAGIGLDVDADLIFLRVDRGVVVFAFGGVGSPFNRGFESKLMHDVASRLTRDFAGGS